MMYHGSKFKNPKEKSSKEFQNEEMSDSHYSMTKITITFNFQQYMYIYLYIEHAFVFVNSSICL